MQRYTPKMRDERNDVNVSVRHGKVSEWRKVKNRKKKLKIHRTKFPSPETKMPEPTMKKKELHQNVKGE